MVRTHSFDNKSGMKKGTWTPEEDKKLIAYVTRYGCWNWRQLPRFAGLARCGKSCMRWLNYLRPDIKRGDYTQEEEEIIVKLHQKLGSRWSVIAANLSGRTDNDIKNHWNSCLKKRFQREKSQMIHDDGNLNKTIEPTIDSGSKNQDTDDSEQSSVSFFKVTSPQNTTSKSFDSGPLSPQLSSSEFSTATADSSSNDNSVIEDLDFEDEDIWSESFLAELMIEDNTVTQIPDTQSLSPQSWNSECFVDAERFGSVEPETTLMIKPTVEKSWIEQCVVPDMKLFAHQSDEYLYTVYHDDDDDDGVEFCNQSKHIGLGLF